MLVINDIFIEGNTLFLMYVTSFYVFLICVLQSFKSMEKANLNRKLPKNNKQRKNTIDTNHNMFFSGYHYAY